MSSTMKKFKENAKDTLKTLKDIDPDVAGKDEFVLYASCLAVLDHGEGGRIESVAEIEGAPIEPFCPSRGHTGVLDDFSEILKQYGYSRSASDRDIMRETLKWQLSEIERELVEMRHEVHDPECVQLFVDFRESIRLKI